MIDIGQNIRAIRELKNLTQDYVAEKLGMSTPNYSNIETGKIDITIKRLDEISDILEVDYRQILSLQPSQIFNHSPYSGYNTHNYLNEELLKQLQIKDEQIQRLTSLLEKSLIN